MRGSNLFVAGVDQHNTAFVCFDSYESFSQCWAIGADSNRPLWREPLPGTKAIAGVAMAPGRLYVATWEGKLFAMGDADAPVGVAEGGEGDVVALPLIDPGPAWDKPEVPGDHPWPMENRDAWGTLWTPFAGPQQATVRWSSQTEGGFVGGPAVAADGTIYVSTALGDLLAFAPDGTQLWQAMLSGGALSGGPALGDDGTIYVTDGGGNLTAFSPDGEIVWRYHATGVANRPISGSVTQPMPLEGAGPASTGPIVDPDGNILFGLAVDMGNSSGNPFIRAEVMQAVSSEGGGLMDDPPFIFSDRLAPRLLQDTNIILWGGNSTYAPEERLYDYYYGYLDEIRDGNDSLRVGTFYRGGWAGLHGLSAHAGILVPYGCGHRRFAGLHVGAGDLARQRGRRRRDTGRSGVDALPQRQVRLGGRGRYGDWAGAVPAGVEDGGGRRRCDGVWLWQFDG